MMEELANFQINMNPNVNLIGLEVYRDGTTPFKRTTDQFGLSFVPFLTFHQHYHCGKILAFDDGDSVWDELVTQDLWINGIIVKGIKYRVAITGVTLDGRGFEQRTRASGL
jgi:hypothetical protein